MILADGRRLGYARYGPSDGVPVVFLPGAGCGRRMRFGDGLLSQRGVLLISVDRPGLGSSTPDPAKTLSSVAADVAHLVDEVIGAPVPVVAHSQGAPFALALATTGRASRVVLAAPIDDMAHPPVNAHLEPGYRALLADVAERPDLVLATLAEVTPRALFDLALGDHPPSDGAVYDDPRFRASFLDALEDGLAGGPDGYARDTVLAMTAWPPELFSPPVPVSILVGADDRAHSPDLARTLAARLGASRTVVPGVGGALPWARPEVVLDAALRHGSSETAG